MVTYPEIKTFDYLKSLLPIEGEIIRALTGVLISGQLILGPETEAFEHEFAEFTGARHCVGVSSGTSALHLTLMALGVGPGDEVITVSNTCVPTVAAIELCGATPVLVDVLADDLMIDPDSVAAAVTNRTKCVLPVHLWGQCVDIQGIMEIAGSRNLLVVEDCAQAHGTMYRGRHVGTFANAGCFSFYPTKNLGAYGDAGAIVTNDDDLAARLRRMRIYGYDRQNRSLEKGMNARISEMQAAILRVKLRYLPHYLARRREIAAFYGSGIRNNKLLLPHQHCDREHSFHQYVIRCRQRDKIIERLKINRIGFGIHYPVPIHLMPAYKQLHDNSRPLTVTEKARDEIFSLPIHEALSNEEAATVVEVLNRERI